MSDKTTAQAQQFASDWKAAMEGQLSQFDAFSQEMSRAQAQGAEQMSRNVEEVARLYKESFSYGLQLTDQWSKITREATRRTIEMMTTTWG